MSFFSRLFAKLFGRKKEKQTTFAPTPDRVPYTPTVEHPPYNTTGKFQQPEVERPRIPAVTQPVNLNTQGWPVGTYEFQPGVYYTPYKGAHGGPFKQPKEATDWMAAVDRRDKALDDWQKEIDSIVYTGRFPAVNFIHGPGEGREAAFISAANRVYAETHSDLEYIYRRAGLFSGTHTQIAQLINYGEQEQIYEHKNLHQTMADFPDTELGRAVREAMAK